MEIVHAAPGDERLADLLATHARFCAAVTPSGSGHALPGDAPPPEDVNFLLAIDGEDELGCIGIKPLDRTHAELKTMHVREASRGRGVGEALVVAACRTARAMGADRLSLETGASDDFAPSRRLYARMGFTPCEPFGPYAHDPFSRCMTMTLPTPSGA